MSFGPFILKDAYICGGIFILDLADTEGTVRHSPGRFVHYSNHDQLFSKALKLKGKLITTETSNPSKNSPEKWWIDINEYFGNIEVISNPITKKSPKYTQEQQECIAIFNIANHLKISAYAGTGKTTTLLGIADSVPNKRGIYLAFNKEIAEEAKKKFPRNVECRTTHSLAFEIASKHYTLEKLTDSLSPIKVAELLKIETISFGVHQNYTPRQVGKWIVDTIITFCRSDAIKLSKEHVTCGRLGLASPEMIAQYTDFLLNKASEVWDLSRNPNSPVPLGHDGYLKLWSISRPRFDKDFIMLDECQDTNAAVIYALSKQNVKTVYVGDRYQQIYGFRGAYNAMDKIHVERETALTTSFRFGDEIAEVANSIIKRFGEERIIIGNPEITSCINKFQAGTYIYRTNMGVLGGLASQLKSGMKPFLLGGTNDLTILVKDIELMQAGKSAIFDSDFFGFSDWIDLVKFSKLEEGSSYRTVVRLVESYGLSEIKKIIEGVTESVENSNVILTTAHKSKGKEWDFVELGEDFSTETRIENLVGSTYSFNLMHVEEITLLYVAITRAKLSLNIPDRILEILNLKKYYLGSKQLESKDNYFKKFGVNNKNEIS